MTSAKKILHTPPDVLHAFGCETEGEFYEAIYKCTDNGAWAELRPDRLRLGAIVEGSDAEVGPVELAFPCTLGEINRAIARIEEEADILWREANEYIDDDDDDEEEND